MSNEKEVSKVEAIANDSIIDIKISGLFYGRIHQMLLYHAGQKPFDEFIKEVKAVRSGPPQNQYQEHLLSLLTLIHEIETKAKAQGKINFVAPDQKKG